MKLSLIFIPSLLFFFSCSDKNNTLIAPKRIDGIPDKAFWIGGTEGGNWYYVEYIHPHRSNAIIKIYNDQNGELIVSKRFILICPENNPSFIDSLQKQINAFDGDKIILHASPGKSVCYLQ
jgi:hypothetical protein